VLIVILIRYVRNVKRDSKRLSLDNVRNAQKAQPLVINVQAINVLNVERDLMLILYLIL
jgi:hypothetical protein